MKKLICILTLLPVLVLAQSPDQNWVKNTTYKKPTTEGNIDVTNPTDAVQQVSYFDGLGSPIQQIAHKQSNTGKDIITHIEYDQFGRRIKEYLPYVNSAPSLYYTDGTSVLSELNNFHGSYNGGTANPFSEKLLENSPLSRVFKQAAPGDAWALPETSGLPEDRSIKFNYQTNTNADNVKLLKATADWVPSKELYDPIFSDLGTYQESQLYKTVTKDENWIIASGKNNTTEEFKNKEGQVVLKRTYSDIYISGALVEAQAKHDTYYVYDQYGNLTFVLPPLAEGTINDLEGLPIQIR
jgi:hypothetical protein